VQQPGRVFLPYGINAESLRELPQMVSGSGIGEIICEEPLACLGAEVKHMFCAYYGAKVKRSRNP
jgi:hypothetical protein